MLRGRLEDRARRELAAGAYELRAWQRPCNGHCGLLDPPTGHCSGPVEVPPDSTTTVVVTFRASEPCTISAS